MRLSNHLTERHIVGRSAPHVVYKCLILIRKLSVIKKLRMHEKRSLPNVLYGSALTNKLDWDVRLRIAIGTSQLLEYLHHDCNYKIIYRGAKSATLKDNYEEAHIAYFGIAKSGLLSDDRTLTFVMSYIISEYVQTSRLTEKYDLYSFGIILWEIVTGRMEYYLHDLIEERMANNITTIMDILDPAISSACKDAEANDVFRLALQCTELKSIYSPRMHACVRVSHVKAQF